MNDRTTLRVIFGVLTLLFAACMILPQAGAQAVDPGAAADPVAVDLDAQRVSLTTISGPWRFHAGDDPSWAKPDYDDSQWPRLNAAKDWMKQGYHEEKQMAWFRFRLKVKPGTKSVTLVLPGFPRSYQFFANGAMLGQLGSLPPQRPGQVIQTARLYTITVPQGSRNENGKPQEIVLALRLWQDAQLIGINRNQLGALPYAGAAPITERMFLLRHEEFLLGTGMDYTQDIVSLVVGGACLLLWLLTRESFYAWFALNLVISCLSLAIRLLSLSNAWDHSLVIFCYIATNAGELITWVLFIASALGLRGRWKIGLPIALMLLAELGPVLEQTAKMPLIWADTLYCVLDVASQTLLLCYLIQGWRKGVVYAKLLAFPFGLAFVVSVLDSVGHSLVEFGVPHADRMLPSEMWILNSPFQANATDVVNLASTLGVLVVLVYRFARTSRERQRLATALQAAHQVQSRLVPVDIPSLGGLRTEIVSLAAEEVGGDFCQVLPRANGSILVAIGDVSGKGLEAALVGALAVGALRSLADEAIEPAAALERLNEVLLRTENKGFITCLCMELTPDGEVTIANAGHLSPYLNGAELALPAGLPLGLVRGLRYEQVSFRLPLKARLTLLSDGVVEARSHGGELFGFDRTQEASQWAASRIAGEAQRHGQEDDITVITLDWAAPAAA